MSLLYNGRERYARMNAEIRGMRKGRIIRKERITSAVIIAQKMYLLRSF